MLQLCYNIIYYIHTEIYGPRSQLINRHTIFFTGEKRRIDALIGYALIFTSEQNRVARSSLLLTDKRYISKSLGAFFFRKMASNQSNRFQSLDSSVEEFIDGQENENTKKKTKHDVALFHEFLVLKGEMRQMDELIPQELNKFLSEFLITVRKKEDNKEYEPNSLRGLFASFGRHLKKKIWTLPHERRPVRANSESASFKAKGSKTERQGQQA